MGYGSHEVVNSYALQSINFKVLRVLTKGHHHILNDYYKNVNRASIAWQFVVQSHLTLCDPMNYVTPGFPVLRGLLEFAQILVR